MSNEAQVKEFWLKVERSAPRNDDPQVEARAIGIAIDGALRDLRSDMWDWAISEDPRLAEWIGKEQAA